MKYLKVLKQIFLASIAEFTIYRIDALLFLIGDLIMIGISLLLFDVIYGKINSIAGWSRTEVIAIIAVYEWIEIFIWIFYQDNLQNFGNLIRTGDLDLILSKPLNKQFLISFRKMSMGSIVGNLLLSVILTIYFISKLDITNIFTRLFFFSMLIILGIIVHYSYRLILSTISFYTMQSYSLLWFDQNMRRMIRYPLEIMPKLVRIGMYTIMPVAFMSVIPVEAFRGEIFDVKWLLISFVGAAFSLLISSLFFRYSVTYKYESASS